MLFVIAPEHVHIDAYSAYIHTLVIEKYAGSSQETWSTHGVSIRGDGVALEPWQGTQRKKSSGAFVGEPSTGSMAGGWSVFFRWCPIRGIGVVTQ